MKDCIYNTDPFWINIIKSLPSDGEINFWRKDSRYLHLNRGAYFYFKVRGTDYIIGRAQFQFIHFLTVNDAWNQYKERNGVKSLEAFQRRLTEIFELPSTFNGLIGCIILENLEWLPDEKNYHLDEITFPRHILASKYHDRGSIPNLENLFQRTIVENNLVQAKQPETHNIVNEAQEEFDDITVDEVNLASDYYESDNASIRRMTTTYRIVRDTHLSLQIKSLYSYQCQLCDTKIESPNGKKYAEAHHIKPLGHPHNGKDKAGNIICVCPNCHAKLDYGMTSLKADKIMTNTKHNISQESIDYHNNSIFSKIL